MILLIVKFLIGLINPRPIDTKSTEFRVFLNKFKD